MAAAQGRRTRPLEGRAAGPQPPCDVPGAAPTPLCRGAAERPWRPEGRPLAAGAARDTADSRRAKPGLARERPVCGAARRPPSAAVT